MTTAVYPGTFDPLTKGHLDIIERAAVLFDELVIGVLFNSAKTPLFSAEERGGLSVDFARSCGAKVIVRGLRLITDFEYELQMAQTNRKLAPDVDTTFLYTALQYSYLSSTTVKEVAALGGDISEFVPAFIEEAIRQKLQEQRR